MAKKLKKKIAKKPAKKAVKAKAKPKAKAKAKIQRKLKPKSAKVEVKAPSILRKIKIVKAPVMRSISRKSLGNRPVHEDGRRKGAVDLRN